MSPSHDKRNASEILASCIHPVMHWGEPWEKVHILILKKQKKHGVTCSLFVSWSYVTRSKCKGQTQLSSQWRTTVVFCHFKERRTVFPVFLSLFNTHRYPVSDRYSCRCLMVCHYYEPLWTSTFSAIDFNLFFLFFLLCRSIFILLLLFCFLF